MKDHEIRELVNDLTKAARKAKDAQCLREIIANRLNPVIRQLQADNVQIGVGIITYQQARELVVMEIVESKKVFLSVGSNPCPTTKEVLSELI